MTLITIVSDASDRIGLQRPSAVMSSTDLTVRTLLGFAQQEGRELARAATWQALQTEKTFTTVAQELQTSAIPTDFDWYMQDTMYNRTSRRKVEGPLTPGEWQVTKATLVTLVNPAFRIRGRNILITPTPSAGDTVAYEYISKNWCESESGTDQSSWAADSDVGLLDEELMTLGVIWRYRKSKGFDYAEDFRSYEVMKNQLMLRDGARPRINSGPGAIDRNPYPPQVPETITFS